MTQISTFEKIVRGILIALVLVFFLFPIFWILLMSFQNNDQILRIPPSLFFEPTLQNYTALLTGRLETTAGNLDIAFMRNLGNSLLLSTCSVAVVAGARRAGGLCLRALQVPPGREHCLHVLSFRFAPPLLVLLPLSLFFKHLHLTDTYIGLIWVYQLICLPLILWIVRGYFEDISPDIEHAYRISGHGWWKTFRKIAIPWRGPGIAAAGLLAFIFAWNNFIFALILASPASSR
jgi:multiple sugar transport system permease protein